LKKDGKTGMAGFANQSSSFLLFSPNSFSKKNSKSIQTSSKKSETLHTP
jgi:hypothetical protein